MEKAWRVTVLIWNENTSSRENAETHKFIVLQHSEEQARASALLKAGKSFPPNEGWAYDFEKATIEELSMVQAQDIIDEHRDQAMKEGEERIDEALADLEEIEVFLKKPKRE